MNSQNKAPNDISTKSTEIKLKPRLDEIHLEKITLNNENFSHS